MNKLNLRNNDIIVIIVIFIVFCIFMFINTKYTYENFQIVSNTKKQTYIDSIHNFVKYMINYCDRIEDINIEYIKILNEFKDIKNINDTIKDTDSKVSDSFKKIKTDIEEIKNLKFSISNNNDISTNLFNIFNTNKNKLYHQYNNLFLSTNKYGDIKICDVGNINYGSDINKFIKNIQTRVDVLLLSNKSSLELLNIYITNIKNNIDKLEFKPDFKDKLLNMFDTYTKLLDVMYNNKHKFNMVNILANIYVEDKSTSDNDNDNEEGKLATTSTMDSFTDYKEPFQDIDKCEKRKKFIETFKKNFTIYDRHLNNVVYTIKTLRNIGYDLNIILNKNNINDIFIVYSDDSNYFSDAKKKLNLEYKFCNKLQGLDKPNKNNLILKRFTDDLIDKKFKYINNLESKIKNIQSLMTDKELYNYNLNRIRTHDQANKQYKAISKGIENIKNRNKVKINLT